MRDRDLPGHPGRNARRNSVLFHGSTRAIGNHVRDHQERSPPRAVLQPGRVRRHHSVAGLVGARNHPDRTPKGIVHRVGVVAVRQPDVPTIPVRPSGLDARNRSGPRVVLLKKRLEC